MTAAALDISDLRKTYDNGLQALKGISLQVAEGDFFALLGANGAGKSTVIGIISSLVNKTSGKINIFGIDIDKDFPRAKQNIGVVPQEFNFNVFESPWNIVRNQAGYYGIDSNTAKERAAFYLDKLSLWDKRLTPSRNLSGGMKRRLMIARALVHEPKLLILDEPTAGVDIEIRRAMWEFLQEINAKGTTIILTTHYLEEAESLCRNIAIIDSGELIENTSMRALLNQLNIETFVLDIAKPLSALPAKLNGGARLLDDHTLEIDKSKEQNLNVIFDVLSSENIKVTSMRNKSNRLEQLFLRLVAKGAEAGSARPGRN